MSAVISLQVQQATPTKPYRQIVEEYPDRLTARIRRRLVWPSWREGTGDFHQGTVGSTCALASRCRNREQRWS